MALPRLDVSKGLKQLSSGKPKSTALVKSAKRSVAKRAGRASSSTNWSAAGTPPRSQPSGTSVAEFERLSRTHNLTARRVELQMIDRKPVTDTLVHVGTPSPQSVGGRGGATTRAAITQGAAGVGAYKVLSGAAKLAARTLVRAHPATRLALTAYKAGKMVKAVRAGQKLSRAQVVRGLLLP